MTQRFVDGMAWRYRALRARYHRPHVQWARVVMEEATNQLLCAMDRHRLDAMEISGQKWRHFGFASYESLTYPDFDICAPLTTEKQCDVLIAEQVFEHLLWPYRAAKNAFALLRPGGALLITTPFLIRIHNEPHDCTRWTETGIKHLLAEAGFPLDTTITGSWGNRDCVIGNFGAWAIYRGRRHSLENDSKLPVVVWALAKKPSTGNLSC